MRRSSRSTCRRRCPWAAPCRWMMLAALGSLPALGMAHDARTDQLAWESLDDARLEGSLHAIVATDDAVVASGVDGPAQGDSASWYVRAMDRRTGHLLWEDRRDGGTPSLLNHVAGIAVEGSRVFAAGRLLRAGAIPTRDLLVRAYALRTGAALWEQELDRGLDEGWAVTAHQGRVFVVGRLGSRFAVLAFDAGTGAELWENVDIAPQGSDALSVAADGGRVFAAGFARNASTLLVRALDARTGRILWEDELPGGDLVSAQQHSLLARGGALYLAGGIVDDQGDEHALVRAYDGWTGAPRWTTTWGSPGRNTWAQTAWTAGDALLVGGEDDADEQFLGGSFAVHTLDRGTGAESWQDRYQLAPGGDAQVNDLVTVGHLAFAGGASQDATGAYAWLIRVYDLRTGALVAADVATDPSVAAVQAMTASGNAVYAAGIRGPVAVRAYTVGHADE
jgi:hypothetical protein